MTYHGSVLVFRVAGPGRRALVATRPGILAGARFPGGGHVPASRCGGDCGAAAYAAGFTPAGRALTVVIAGPGTQPGTGARDTVFTWQVAGPGPGRPHRGRRLRHRRPGTPVDPALTRPAAPAGA